MELKKLYNKVNKMSLIKKIMLIVLASIIITLLSKYILKREGFSGYNESDQTNNKLLFDKRTGDKIYDDTYASIYDNLVFNRLKNNYEVNKIISITAPKEKSKVLDVGCGTGHHVNLFDKKDLIAYGIDSSPSMIKIAKERYPTSKYKVNNALNPMIYEEHTFAYITCLYFTIYYIKDKNTLFNNCFKWLLPGGILILHLVDMNKFDPILPIGNNKKQKENEKQSRRKTTSIYDSDNIKYSADFTIDNTINSNTTVLNNANATFKEKIKFKNFNTVRINEHKLYMNTQKSILAIAKNNGFILQSIEELDRIDYQYNYLYFLVKPS